MEAPVLAYPNSEHLFIMDTDISNHATGTEILQIQNGVERLIGFGSFILASWIENWQYIVWILCTDLPRIM